MDLNWKKLFNWDIASVLAVETITTPGTLGRDVIGYKVVVNYVHHGKQEIRFMNDNEQMWTLYNGPRDAALQTYKSYMAQMNKQKARLAARQK